MSDQAQQPQEVQPVLLHERDARGVHTLTLNSPATYNALGEDMLAALAQALQQVQQDDAARAVVLAARGKAFCAGHDLKQMRQRPELHYYRDLFNRCAQVMLQIQRLPVPVVARVHALATAAGCQLVAQCDLAVAAQTARFGVNGIDVGLFCSAPAVPLVRNVPAKVAMEMLLTGDFLSAEEAQQRGLVNRVVPPEALDDAVEALLERLLSKPRQAMALGKATFYQQRETGIESAYQLAAQAMACNLADPVAQEGVQAFIDKRPPAWKM